MKRLLKRMLDETEFLPTFGVRALSRARTPSTRMYFVMTARSSRVALSARPNRTRGLFGGNSNWRGPIWFPVNFLIIESLQKFHHYYGDDFKVECPTGSGQFMTLDAAANELALRLTRIFLQGRARRCARSAAMNRACRRIRTFATTYCSTNTSTATSGRGVGASHQTGWTGLVAKLLMPRYARDELHSH